MLPWDLTIFGNKIGNKDRGEVIPSTWFHSFFLRKRSEIRIAFTFFKKWKVKNKISSLFFQKWKWNWNGSRSRTRSEKEKNSREFSRNENLAGLCSHSNWCSAVSDQISTSASLIASSKLDPPPSSISMEKKPWEYGWSKEHICVVLSSLTLATQFVFCDKLCDFNLNKNRTPL